MNGVYPQLDRNAARTWIYPTNYPVRNYQREICETALFQNTLVCLPTGLGKTLIAAVTIYNFYRWYPTGKVVFLAPTKPLVTQQIKACHGIMGIPEDDTAHLDGAVQSSRREAIWRCKRVFYCTPQTFDHDLADGTCDPRSVVLVVVDEAHRATNSFSYTTAIATMSRYSNHFRVLALSATPGSETRKIQNVINNLRIARI
jgi:ERCC4-related helicase